MDAILVAKFFDEQSSKTTRSIYIFVMEEESKIRISEVSNKPEKNPVVLNANLLF